ncbi:hypothetical protein [Roseospira goensis]|uniref:Uncharacterized protein n=1 Tax=Roseospira goensis TaxID=391922 RepID=A0A7W6WKD2_9PROT|nr:hypothetical protein [Roseospira goensis]MBB4286201.1 hypothetical protein [Roseospira goensis]
MAVEVRAGAGLFDDLIPQSSPAPSPPMNGGLFDDLIPAARPQAGEQAGTDIGTADHFVRQLGAGAAAAGASALQAPAILAGQVDSAAQRARRRTLEAMDRLDAVAAEGGRPGEVWGTLDSRDTTVLRDAARYWRALKAGDTDEATALRRRIEGEIADVAPTLTDPRETALYGAGEAVRDLYDEPGAPLHGNPDYKGDFWRDTVPNALGSTGAFLATGAAGAAARVPAALAAGATGAAVNSTDTFREALESGADLETAYRAATGGAAVGAGEGLPIGQVLKRLDAVGGRRMRRIIAEGLKGMGEEAAQEALNAVGNNLIAAGLYDPERDVLEGAGESAAAGGAVGAIFSVVASTFARQRGGATDPTAPRADLRDGDDGFAEAPGASPPLPPGPKPEPGARVTVATPDGPVAGTVESVDRRGAMVRLDDTGDLEPVALRDLQAQPPQPAGLPPVETVDLNEGDLRSPIPNEIIGEGKAAMEDAINAASAPAPAPPPPASAGAPTGAPPSLFDDLIPERPGGANAGPPPLDLTEDMVVDDPPPLDLTEDMIVDTAPDRWRARQDQRDALVARAQLEPGAYVDRDGVPYHVDPEGRIVRGGSGEAEAFGSLERGYVDDQGEAFARRALAGEMRRVPGDQALAVGARVAVADGAGTVVSAGGGEIAVRLDGTGDIEPFPPGAVRPLPREPRKDNTGPAGSAPEVADGAALPAPAETQRPAVTGASLDRTASWVIRDRRTGDAILETFDRRAVEALNTDRYEAVPIQDHLGGAEPARCGAPGRHAPRGGTACPQRPGRSVK